jgi:hypothetical protein
VTVWEHTMPAKLLRHAFWAAIEPQLERLTRDTRAMWEHIKLLVAIDPERLSCDDWEATPQGLVATRTNVERDWEAIFAYMHPSVESQVAVSKLVAILYRQRGGQSRADV